MSSEQEFKNDDLSIKVKKEPFCVVKLEVVVAPSKVEDLYRSSVKSISKEVSLPGFRKGKAPEAVIIQNYSNHVQQEWQENVIKLALDKSIEVTHLYPLQNTLKRPQVRSCSREAGAVIFFEYEMQPEVPSVDATEWELKNVEIQPVTPEKIEEALEEIRHYHAQWQEIVDRPLQENDYVELDIDALDEPPQNLCVDTRFHVVPGKMAHWMLKLVIGLSVNESVEGMSEKEEDTETAHKECNEEHCQHESHQFKPRLCRLTIKSIKQGTLPVIDDELAKKVGAQNVEDLRMKIVKRLENNAKNHVKASLRSQVEEKLVKHYSFDLPRSLMENEKKERSRDKIREFQQGNAESEIESRKVEIENDAVKEAKETLTLYFIIQKLADDLKVQVSQQELMEELTTQLWQVPPHERIISDQMDQKEVRSRLYLNVLSRKVKDLLADQAKKI